MPSNAEKKIEKLLIRAKQSSFEFTSVKPSVKNKALKEMAEVLNKNKKVILKANQKDLSAAKKKGLKDSFVERLTLTEKRIEAMAVSLEEIARQKDPVGEVIAHWKRPNGLNIRKVRVPLGVIFIIYESRPNVTADCIGLCLRSSNVCILRGGKDALNSNLTLFSLLKKTAAAYSLDKFIYYIEDISYHAVDFILKNAHKYIDLVIPRGGRSLIEKVNTLSTAPVIKHYQGICHLYIDKSADLNQAVKISINAKTQRPSVCNAVETILVHKNIAQEFLPKLKQEFDKFGVEIRGCKQTCAVLKGIKKAKEQDWRTEYLDLIVSIRVVSSINEAIKHINTYGSLHTDSIIAKDKKTAQKFTEDVGSACVFVNTSTRFSDGGEFGLGAEIGISTDKIHARGPMGAYELTTYKYVVSSRGKIRV